MQPILFQAPLDVPVTYCEFLAQMFNRR